jgi:hypothetical protein
MQTPEARADTTMEEFIRDALGPVDAHHISVVKGKIWQAINEEKVVISRESTNEEG